MDMIPCTKENDIKTLYEYQTKTHDILIELKTLVEKLVNYQIQENSKQIENHEQRIKNVESLETKIIAWSSVGGIIGGTVLNLVMKYIIK